MVILSQNMLTIHLRKERDPSRERHDKHWSGRQKGRGIRCVACSCDFVVFREVPQLSISLRNLFCSSCSTSFTSAPQFLVWLQLHNGDLSHEPPPWWQLPVDRKKTEFTIISKTNCHIYICLHLHFVFINTPADQICVNVPSSELWFRVSSSQAPNTDVPVSDT